MRKTIVAMLAAAAVLVVGGALGAIAQTDEGEGETDTAITAAVAQLGHKGERLAGLLEEMVEDGVITSEQADSITEWLENKHAEVRAEREAMREAFEEAWSDGILTAEEAAQFPFGERLAAIDGLWADGQVTQEEWDAFRAEFPRRGVRHRLGQ